MEEYRDRRTGLVLFGVLQVLLGALSALFVPLMLLSMEASPQPGQSARAAVAAALFYAAAAVSFAWWGAALVAGGWGASSAVTFLRTPMRELYLGMGLGDEAADMVERMGLWNGPRMLGFTALWMLGFFGYLVWVRRWFRTGEGGRP